MPIKVYKKNRAARKNASIIDRSDIHRGKPYKKLTTPKKRISGRGKAGKITVRRRGGGAKKAMRRLDYGQEKMGVPAIVERIEYDPNRSAHVALLLYKDGDRRYRLAWEGAKPGAEVVADEKAPETDGNRMQLQHITPGLTVYNVEIKPGRKGTLLRAAGCYGIVMDIQDKHAQIKMSSGEVRLIPKEAYGTLGKASNGDWRLVRIGSAGRSRRMGRRPSVRGKVMNPNDHPHGGGEGLQSIGLKHPKTKWGKPALGVKTRKKRKYSNNLILKRRGKKRK